MSSELPIGFFDSGVGGISVLKEHIALMPNENYLYYCDSLHAPYGIKEHSLVMELTLTACKTIIEQGVKALVVACNTATSVAINRLRTIYETADHFIPIIGIEPALKPAVHCKTHPKIVVLATPMTLSEKKFAHLMECYQEEGTVITIGAPKLVEFIENGDTNSKELHAYIKSLFPKELLFHLDAVVLGCTHFPLAKEAIASVLPKNVTIFDGARGTAKETKRRLEALSLLSANDTKGVISFQNSSNDQKIVERCKAFLKN